MKMEFPYYETSIFDAFTKIKTPYGEVTIEVRSTSKIAFDYVNSILYGKYRENGIVFDKENEDET